MPRSRLAAFAPPALLVAAAALAPVSATRLASAQDRASDGPPSSPPPSLSADAHIDIAPTPPEGKTTEENLGPSESVDYNAPPPPRPRHKGLVLESTLGVLGFAGAFRHVAPAAPWVHGQLGYEIFDWLMLFGEAELALTDTSESQDESHQRAFPIWGFGGGARVTVPTSRRVALFVQGDVGALTAIVPKDALVLLGYREAESLHASFGGRLGLELRPGDRHLSIAIEIGLRDATGFSSAIATGAPLMWDGSAGMRYTF